MSGLVRRTAAEESLSHRKTSSGAHGLLPEPTPAGGQGFSLANTIDAFMLSRRVGNCSARTVETYDRNLRRFAHAVDGDLATCTSIALQRYLARLREQMKPITVHQHFRCLRTLFTWATEVGLLPTNPIRGLTMKAPQTLPWVPEDWEVVRLLEACPSTWEGIRNRTLAALLADSALRISEALRLRIGDIKFSTQTLTVHEGKGQRDGVSHFGRRTAEQLRVWLAVRGGPAAEDLVFCTREGRPLVRQHATRILHRLSAKAGLARKIGPHALRHYAATAILRRTGDLELTRRVLRHATLAMALRYAHLTGADVAAKFQMASPLDNLSEAGTRGRKAAMTSPSGNFSTDHR